MQSRQTPQAERRILRTILEGLAEFDNETKSRILKSVAVFFQVDFDRGSPLRPTVAPVSPEAAETGTSDRDLSFAARPTLSPKHFLLAKQPATDIERVACLGYYLAHYRGLEHFKTVDISKLNTEAAQLKFSNPSFSVENAAKRGFLAPASKGCKQLTALGERFVDALPDRVAAKAAGASLRPRNRRAKNRKLRSNKRSGKE